MPYLFLTDQQAAAIKQALSPYFVGREQESLLSASDVIGDAVSDNVATDIDNLYDFDASLQAMTGAGLIGLTDLGGHFTGTDVEAALAELAVGKLNASGVSAFGLSLIDDADATTARTTLGLGTAATQAATAFQPASTTLTNIAGQTFATDSSIYWTSPSTASTYTLTGFGRTLAGSADASAARTSLGLGTAATQASSAFQSADATLTALASLTTTADRGIYATASDTFSTYTLTAFGRSLVDDADAATARTTLGLGTAATQASTAFQPVDATLTALAGLTTSADMGIYATASDTFTTYTLTSFGRSLVDDADASAARTTLGLGSFATKVQTVSTASPSGTPADGDVWLKYTP